MDVATQFSRHFHVIVDVASCSLNLSILLWLTPCFHGMCSVKKTQKIAFSQCIVLARNIFEPEKDIARLVTANL
jgi:hypothetical protein